LRWSTFSLSLPLKGKVVTKLLRVWMWSSVTLAIIFQAAFLIELHSPQAMDEMLWSLLGVSAVCFITFLYARRSLSSIRKWRR
jgi:hypothetical protein